MKCIKKEDTVVRVSDEEAFYFTKKDWKYCPKHEWKKAKEK